jgi:cytochrome c biogenesis protein ResB
MKNFKIIVVVLLFLCTTVCNTWAGPRYYKHSTSRKGKKFSSSAQYNKQTGQWLKHHSPLQIKACNKAKKKRAKLTKQNMKYPTYIPTGY